jgi:exopolysaccharide biosynthesis WecB/TagA/CpsF family protein
MQELSTFAARSPGLAPSAGDVRRIGPVAVSARTEAEALSILHEGISTRTHRKLAFCNAHVVNLAATDPAFRSALATFLVLPDGVGVDLASRLICGAPFPANLNGTDFIPRLVGTAPRALRIGLLGARPGVAEKAAAALHGIDPRHEIIALGDGFLEPAKESRILARLAAEPVDILLVAMGNPRQEMWIAERITGRHAHLAIGVGALFDFLAGEVPRAPAWVRRLRLEWLYRLSLEPARLWRRYVVGNPVFLLRILRQKWRGDLR